MAWRFTEVVVGKQPPPRHMHASAVIDGALYVVGGQHRLDVLQDAWTLRIDDQPYDWRKLKLQKTGKLLKNRIFFGHAAYGSKLYISGGSNHQNMSEVFDDIIVLDTETETLSTLETEAEGIERPRLSRHSMAAMGGSLWMVGGWDGDAWLDSTYRLDLYAPTPRWTQLDADGFVPWRRMVRWPLGSARIRFLLCPLRARLMPPGCAMLLRGEAGPLGVRPLRRVLE